MTETFFDIEVGTELLMYSSYRSGEEKVVVTKVGRTLFYIEEYGRPTAFRKESGYENVSVSHRYVLTPYMKRLRLERVDLERRLKDCGLEFRMGFRGKVTDSQLRKIVHVLETEK